jgi:hypothetical protein
MPNSGITEPILGFYTKENKMGTIRETDGDIDRDQDDSRMQQQRGAEEVEVEPEQQERQELEVEIVESSGDDEQGDERIAQGDDAGEQREQRRETSAERRKRAKEAKLRDKRELDFQKRELDRLQRTVWDLTQGQIATRVTELDNRITSADAEVKQWDLVKAKAITAKNGEDAVAADNLRSAAQLKLDQARWEKQRIADQQRQPVQVDTSVEGFKQQFFADNKWYNPNGVDEDSLIVKAIDNAVAQQYRPSDPTYWEELQKRVNARLGKNVRKNNEADDSDDEDDGEQEVHQERQQRRGGPPVGGSTRSNSTGGGSKVQIMLSPERVQAMKDAGYWDDPVVRQKMAKKYSEYDRQNRG